MFDLEQAITRWREQMSAANIGVAALDELENHLREEITRQIQSQQTPEQAFAMAAADIGDAAQLKTEFTKIKLENWRPSFAWTAWILFTVSFFMPAYGGGAGWQCATTSIIFWHDCWHDLMIGGWDWFSIHLSLLTLANLLMLASPLLLFRFPHHPRLMTGLRWFGLMASILTWSFLFLIMWLDGVNGLKIGSYAWATSFVLLNLATFKKNHAKEHYA